jgi:hypothetical protein
VASDYDPLRATEPELARPIAAAVPQRIALGEGEGQKVRHMAFPYLPILIFPPSAGCSDTVMRMTDPLNDPIGMLELAVLSPIRSAASGVQ